MATTHDHRRPSSGRGSDRCPTPTSTDTPTPTATPSCTLQKVSFGFGERLINQSENGMVKWQIRNNGISSVILQTLYIRWPLDSPRLHLNSVEMNNQAIWNSNYEDKTCPNGSICASLPAPSWSGLASDRRITPGSTANLNVLFSRQLEAGEYYLEASFQDEGSGANCTLLTQSGSFSTPSGN